MNPPPKVLITGSSGFIGSHLVTRMRRQGYIVAGIDIRATQFEENDIARINCDMLDHKKMDWALKEFRPDYVIHLAARTDLDENKNIEAYAVNIQGVRNLLSSIKSLRSVRRCIFTSSQLVRKVGYLPMDDQEYCPNTLYGQSKVLGEKIVREADGGGVEWCLVRPTTIWGVGMNSHYQRFFRMIRDGRYFHIGHKPLYKSYGYVGNTVYQYQCLLEASRDDVHRRTFYLAEYQPISLRAWVDAFQRELEAKPVPTLSEGFAKIAAKLGDIINFFGFKAFPFNSFRLNNILTEYCFDLSTTERVCGPLLYTFNQGIKETAAWIRTL